MRADEQSPTSRSVGVHSRTSHFGEWNGVAAEAVEWHCSGQSHFDLTSARYRLGFVLEQGGGVCETRTDPGVRGGYIHGGRPFISVSPPGMRVWACSDDIQYTRSLALEFDQSALTDCLQDELVGGRELLPHLNFQHPQLCVLGQMLAAECRSPGEFGKIYADSLITAILVAVVRQDRLKGSEPALHRLAPWQFRIAIDYMESHADDRLLLRDLASVTGLSQSHFSRAFKATTGVPPYQWHLSLRIKRAQHHLLNMTLSIAEIAAMTGFADQAHLTRVFARITGTTPAAWQRERLR